MSKIPYQFYPIPHEFLKDEFIEDPFMMKLIRYIMKRISACPQKMTFKNNRTLTTIELQPFEFVFGRKACAEELGVSEKIIRLRMEKLRASSYLKEIFLQNISSKGVNRERASSWASSSEGKRASTFSVYRLSTESFSKLKGQQFLHEKGQQLFDEKTSSESSIKMAEQREGQQLGHKQETKEEQDVLCLKETSKEKIVHNSVVPLFPSHMEKKEHKASPISNEDEMTIEAYLDSYDIVIDRTTIRRWLKNHGLENIIDTIGYFIKESKKRGIPNPGGWMTTALKENWAKKEQFSILNREFAKNFKETKKITHLKLNKRYCIDTETRNEYYYNIDPQIFEQELKRKYE